MVFLWELLGTVAFVVLFGALVLRWLSQGGARLPSPFSDPLPKREGSFPAAKTLGWVFVTALLFRIAVALGGLLLYNLVNGTVVEQSLELQNFQNCGSAGMGRTMSI